MSNTRNAILGVIAVSATLGAAQLASGHDLTSSLKAFTGAPIGSVNRAAKGDRFATVAASGGATQTISIHVKQVADTSVLVRIPQQRAKGPITTGTARHSTRNSVGSAPAPSMIQSQERKATVACEPVVSVLTDIAKRLQPGRCVT
jgi:hypothetical protein